MKIFKPCLAIAIMLVAFASCKKSSDALTNVIPADALGVYHVDVQSLVKKSNYDIFKNETVLRGVNLAKGMLGKKEAVDMLDALTQDINALGLNLKGDCYAYFNGKTIGVVLGVNDAEKFKNALIDFSLSAEAIEKENGIYILDLDKNVVVAWSSDKLLLAATKDMYRYRSDAKEIDLKTTVLQQLVQGADESINSNPVFAEFLKEKKDISAFYALTDSYFDLIKTTLSGADFPIEVTDALVELKGASSTSYISFDKGEIAITSKAYYPNSDVEKKYKDLTNQMMGELKGEQLKLIPANAIFAASANIKGAGVYDFLGKLGLYPLIEKQDEEGLVKTILNEVDGDITFALTDITTVKKSYELGGGEKYEYDSTEPQLTFLIDTKDGNKAIEVITNLSQQTGDSLIEIAPATYSFKEAYIAVKGNTLSFTNNKESLDNQPVATDLSALAKDKIVVLGGDIKPLKAIASKNIPDEDASTTVGELISLFDTYNMTSTRETGEGKVIMTDKSQNSLAAICQWLDKTLTSLNGKLNF
jgi:hypothetical protein